jgi:ribonuclease D
MEPPVSTKIDAKVGVKIGKDELAQLPVRRYEGPICLIETPHDLDRARHEFHRESVVGLDTETPPTFRPGQSHLPSLVQVATSREVFLFQLKRLDFADALAELLESEGVIKAGIGLDQDFSKLKMRFPFEEKSILDLTPVARRQGLGQTGVRNLAGMFLGFRVTKGQKTSNWGRLELTSHQIRYAATDAWVCRELYLCFQQRGFLENK